MALVDWKGESFTMAESVGLMPLMRFAVVAKAGADSEDLDGLIAMYELLEQCLHEDDWERFQTHATKTHASGEEMMELIGKVMAALSERPTSRPSESSPGPTASTDGSKVAFLRRVSEGRPDLEAGLIETALARGELTG